MGKRELFIILGFVAVGIVAYQLTAPASTSEGFSFSKVWEAMRREVHGNPSQRGNHADRRHPRDRVAL